MTATMIDDTPAGVALADFQLVPLDELHESPKNPRTHYDPVALKQLADNLKAVGQITPLVVRPRRWAENPNVRDQVFGYEIAAGHRRARAAKLAGLPALTAIVRDLDDAQFVEILNVENLQRDDLNALEEAQGFKTLMTDAGYDVARIAERMGRSVKYVYDRLKLLQLIPEAKQLLLDGTISPAHGILLARLSEEDQKRALVPDDTYRGGGLLEHEHVDDSYFQGEPELALGDPKKARSTRELKQWIDDNVRFVPEKVDQGDLVFDLPKTAELLDTAATNKLKVIKITRSYRVPDAARDEKERTYGQQSWKRADGEPEPFDRFGPAKKAKPSKTCDHAVVGVVVAGPGRGEAFLVCVNKDKCSVHWAEEMKERAKRATASKPNATGARAEGRQVEDRWEKERARRKERAAAEAPVRRRIVTALLDHVQSPLPESVLRLVTEELQHGADLDVSTFLELLQLPVPKKANWNSAREAIAKLSASSLARAMVLGLVANEVQVNEYDVEHKPERLLKVCAIYGLDVRALAAEAKAAQAAASTGAATKAKQPGKSKRRAGDVARAKKTKKAKGGASR